MEYIFILHIIYICLIVLLINCRRDSRWIKSKLFCLKCRLLNKEMCDSCYINESSIINGIKNQEFYIVYQPQINLLKDELYGVEALIRWNHPQKGIIPPYKFISVAEESNAIINLGRWVIEEGCKQLNIWNRQGYYVDHLSINISAIELRDIETVNFIKKILKKYEVNPKQLIFEITESSSAKKYIEVQKNLIELNNIGVKIAIDDFGKEYSGLSYLLDLPVKIIKVDKIFIDKVHKDNRIMKIIINLANSMNLEVIAEGVETEEQLKEINDLGCNVVQGYYYEKPIKAEDIEKKYL